MFIVASCVNVLGLKVETLEKPLYVSSPLGIRVRIDQVSQGCEVEILGILLTGDLRVMDVLDFHANCGRNGLTAHLVIIDCSSRRITTYT